MLCRESVFAVLLSLISILNPHSHAGTVGIAHYEAEMDVLEDRTSFSIEPGRVRVLAEQGRYDEAISEISRAMARHGHPAYDYSRGIVYLKKGEFESARTDLAAFLDWVTGNDDPRRSLVYPGLLCADSSRQWDQLNNILQNLTGRNPTTHDQWRTWWQGARENFEPAQRAQQLGPGGLQSTRAG